MAIELSIRENKRVIFSQKIFPGHPKRSIIMYKKVQAKSFKDAPELEALKLQWCEMGLRVWNMEENFFELAKVATS